MFSRIRIISPLFTAVAVLLFTVSAAIHSDAAEASSLTWKQMSPKKSPSARAAFAMAYDPVSKKVVLFGGYNNSYLNETWTFDGTTWTQQNTKVAPPVRAASSMAFDQKTRKLVLFGGFNGSQYLGDTWLWNGATSKWTQAKPKTSPTAVTGPMLFTDPIYGHADEYGGFDGTFYQLDTWRWTGSNWKQLNPGTSPWARSSAVIGLDVARKNVVLFGGLGDVRTDNTWTWDGTNWTQQSPSTQPPTVYYPGTAYDPVLKEVVTFGGGSGGQDQNGTWAWTGTDWTQLQPGKAPAAREALGMAYDAASHQVLIFGGQSSGYFNDTWKLVGK